MIMTMLMIIRLLELGNGRREHGLAEPCLEGRTSAPHKR